MFFAARRADGEVLFRVSGSEVTVEYFDKHGFDKPLIVDKKDGLGLKVPLKDFSIADVERCVGECASWCLWWLFWGYHCDHLC